MIEPKIDQIRIAVDARPLAQTHNGISQYVREVLSRMVTHYPQCRWYLYSDRPPVLNEHLQGLKVRLTNTPSRPLGIWHANTTFARWAKQDQTDLFWSPRHQLPLFLDANITRVVTLHDMVFQTHPSTMRRGSLLLERLLTPRSLRQADMVLTTSQYVSDEVQNRLGVTPERIRTAHLASSVVAPSDCDISPPETPYILVCGSLEPRKNLDRLIKAFARLKSAPNAPPHRLIFVSGGGWKNATTHRLLQEHRAVVELKQNVSETNKACLIANCDFLAVPSLSEGFGLPAVEAMQLGKPILAAQAGALPEVAENAALYVDPLDEESILSGLTKLTTDRVLRDRLAVQARLRGAQFDWMDCAKTTMSALLEAHANHER